MIGLRVTVKDFLKTDLKKYERKHLTVFLSDDKRYKNMGIVEDKDGLKFLIDMTDLESDKVNDQIDQMIRRYNILDNGLKEVLTASEADELLGLVNGRIRTAISEGRFKDQYKRGLLRKSANTWLISKQALKEVYANKFIKEKK